MAEIQLDGSVIDEWDAFHDQCAATFGFPAFYGRNMNAWIDCLTYIREGDGMSRFPLGPRSRSSSKSSALRSSVAAPEGFVALAEGAAAVISGRWRQASAP